MPTKQPAKTAPNTPAKTDAASGGSGRRVKVRLSGSSDAKTAPGPSPAKPVGSSKTLAAVVLTLVAGLAAWTIWLDQRSRESYAAIETQAETFQSALDAQAAELDRLEAAQTDLRAQLALAQEVTRALHHDYDDVAALNEKVNAFIAGEYNLRDPEGLVFLRQDYFQKLTGNDHFLAATGKLIREFERYRTSSLEPNDIIKDYNRILNEYFDAIETPHRLYLPTTLKAVSPGDGGQVRLTFEDTTVRPSQENLRYLELPLTMEPQQPFLLPPQRVANLEVGARVDIYGRLIPQISIRLGEDVDLDRNMPGATEARNLLASTTRDLEDADRNTDETLTVTWQLFLDAPDTAVVWAADQVLTPAEATAR